MEGDGMSAADKIKEADWRLFRSRLPIWQEAYMERLNREYIALLSGTGSASEKFWELERRMREDKRRGGVVMRMSRSNMELNLLSLLSDGVISTAELDGFSEELREKLTFVLRENWQGPFLCAAPELTRALENILDNAVGHTPAGGTVTLDVSKAEDTLVFTVTDTGPGFTPEALHKAGQFLYTDAARPGNGHQGLGLYLARSVAQAYGGKLVLANTGIGAQAQLCLPMQ